MRNLFIAISLICIFSCKTEIDIDIPDRTPVLVVNAEVSADSIMWMNLSLTQNVKDNKGKPFVSDAFIEVYDKDTLILDVLTHTNAGNYSGSLKSKPGETYIFRINLQGNSYAVKQRIPDKVRGFVFDTSRIIFQGKKNFFKIELAIRDSSSEDNYYGIRVKRLYDVFQGTDTLHLEEWVALESIDFVLTENPKTKFSKQNLMFTDHVFNGSRPYELLEFGAPNLFSIAGQKTRKLIVYTTSYTKEGYDYYTSVNEHIFYQSDPFSQPTLVLGNVPGAYGAIIGKNHRADTITLK